MLAIPTGTSTRCSPSSTRTLQTFPESSEMATGQYPGACWTRTPGYWLYRSEASGDQVLCFADPTQRRTASAYRRLVRIGVRTQLGCPESSRFLRRDAVSVVYVNGQQKAPNGSAFR